MTRLCSLAALSLLLLCGVAQSSALAYTCTVKRVYDLTDNGTLEVSGFEQTMKDSSFSVSRVTGGDHRRGCANPDGQIHARREQRHNKEFFQGRGRLRGAVPTPRGAGVQARRIQAICRVLNGRGWNRHGHMQVKRLRANNAFQATVLALRARPAPKRGRWA